jgi:hypothetical protein
MIDLSNRRARVVDTGISTGLAFNLARFFGQVEYFQTWDHGNPSLLDIAPGHGYGDVKRIRDFWTGFESVDLFVFPDCSNADLQVHLETLGMRVWGSRAGVTLELDRVKTKELIKDAGLPVSAYQQVRGLDDLRSLLREKTNCFVKLSRWRGDMESWHHINYALSEPRLDELAFRFGPIRNQVVFVVEDAIETDIEVGYDGICVDGRFPNIAMQGYESKDCGLLAAVMQYEDLPGEVREVNERLAPTLSGTRYRNFLSTEIRVGEDSLPYLIDVTCRQPCPSGEIQGVLYKNLGEVLWIGAGGELVPIEPLAKFAAEAMIYSEWAHKHWMTVEVETEAQPFVTFFNSTNISETVEAVPPMMEDIAVVSNEIGAVVGLGDTVEEAIEHLKKNADGVKGMGVKIRIDALAELITQIEKAQAAGMKFSDAPLPEPASVLEG